MPRLFSVSQLIVGYISFPISVPTLKYPNLLDLLPIITFQRRRCLVQCCLYSFWRTCVVFVTIHFQYTLYTDMATMFEA